MSSPIHPEGPQSDPQEDAILLEYVYGCAEDPAAIEARLAADPAYAARLEAVRAQAEVLDAAAQETLPELDLTPPAPGSASEPKSMGRLIQGFFGGTVPRRVASVIFALAMALPWIPVQRSHSRATALAENNLRLVASAPAGVVSGAPSEVRIETWDLEGGAVGAQVDWRTVDDAGNELASGTADIDGLLELDVAPSNPEKLTAAAKVELVATRGDTVQRLEVPIAPGRDVPLAHLKSDKPVYRPGETVRLRAVVLDRISLTPRDGRFQLRLVDTKDAPAQSWTREAESGVVALEYQLPPDAAGGTWAFELRDGTDSFTVERLPVEVRAFQPPQLAKTLELDAKTYAPGESGSAELDVQRVTGGPSAGADIAAALWIDGERVWREAYTLGADGKAVIAFTVPDEVERGEARLVARITDGGVVESAVETFIVPTGHVDASIYPEGGELAPGVAQRVYVELADVLGRPVDGRGQVVDDAGRKIADFATTHQGRGVFTAAFEAGATYALELESPSEARFELPAVKTGAVALEATGSEGRVVARLQAPGDGPWTVGVFCRGLLIAQDWFQGSANEITFELPAHIAGVLRVTAFDNSLRPVAERLVHCSTSREVRVTVEPAVDALMPGEHQSLKLRATDENGDPVQAVLGIAVRDSAVVSMAADQPTGLADAAWLLADVDDLEEAPAFLGGDAESEERIDLVLGTRGWRRFAWANPEALVAEHGDAGKRLLVREGHSDAPRVYDVGAASSRSLYEARRDVRWGKSNAMAINALLMLGLAVLAISVLVARKAGVAWPLVAGVALPATALGLFALQQGLGSGDMAEGALAGAAIEVRADAAPPMELALEAPQAQFDELAALGYADGEGFVLGKGEQVQLGAPAGRLRHLGYADAPGAAPVPEAAAMPAPPMDPMDAKEDFAGDMDMELAEPEADARANRGLALKRRAEAGQWQRVYAHRHSGPSDVRTDFTETVYWNPLLVTGVDGTAQVDFDVSDRVTTWEVSIDAHGANRVGQASSGFEAVPPLALEAKLPLELRTGDRITLPISFASADTTLAEARFDAYVEGPLTIVGEVPERVALTGGRGRVLVTVVAGAPAGPGDIGSIAFAGRALGFTDQVVQDLVVMPRGFPQRIAKSGVLEGTTEFQIALPADWEPGSLSVNLALHASPLSDLLSGLDGILREPHGCFEQASTANYPNVLAMNFMDAAGIVDPAATRRANELMERGYAKLVGYECSEDGFEWFGGSPAHESLSAYGLLQFHDMAGVYEVSPELIDRTRAWLLSRRNGKGGYDRNSRALDSFGAAPEATTDAYVTYALAVTGTPPADFEGELDRLEGRGLASDDPYEVALAAAACQAAGRPGPAKAMRGRLSAMQAEDGSMPGAEASITRSGTRDLNVETTALAVLAWLDDPSDEIRVRRGVEWLLTQRSSGRFGSTQATIQALRALTAYARFSRRTANAGEVIVYVDDYEVSRIAFEAGRRELLEFTDLLTSMTPGAHRVRLELTGGNRFPWAFDAEYYADVPADDPNAVLALEVSTDSPTVVEGEVIPVRVTLRNLTDEGQPMALAIVGLPAGLECPVAILDALVEAGDVAFWEQNGGEIVLYWRDLAPGATKEVILDCLGRVPGETTGAASRAYLYYTPDAVRWAQPMAIEVPAAK